MRNCTIVSRYLAIFSPSSTCVDEPHWCCGCCRDCDHCSHALLGGPSVVCIIVEPVPCCIHSVPTQPGSAAVCTVTWGQWSSQFITIYMCETPAENCQIGWDHQFDFLWHSNNLFWNKIQQKKNTWTRIFSALNSCQIHKYLCITCDEILYLYYITAIIFLIRLHTL